MSPGNRSGLCLLLLILAAASASAAQYYVTPNGDDTVPGMAVTSAWKTISRGVRDLKSGDVLTIAPGIYDEQVVVTVSGTAQAPIVIRAQRPGSAVIKASKTLAGFERVPGTRFVNRVRVAARIYNVVEADTRRMLLRAPGVVDLEQFRCAYYCGADGYLYVHTSDGRPAAEHKIEATLRHDYGLILKKAQYVHVEGLALQGHFIADRAGHGFGMSMQTACHCEVRHCTFVNNAGGITFNYNSTDDIVRDCTFVGNSDPLYGELAQLYVSAGSERIQAIDNVVLDAQTHGIRFYNGAKDCRAEGNVISNARIGLYYKATKGTREAVRNVVVGCSYFNFGSGENPGPFREEFNTFQQPSWVSANNIGKLSESDLVFKQTQPLDGNNPEVAGTLTTTQRRDDADPRFCDPDHLDYRLQADSPFRGKAPGGKDQGAYQYDGNVFFVGPQGDDASDGLCVARAWQTLAKACAEAKPGDTIYLLPGEYAGPLAPARSGTREKRIVFRGRGRDLNATVDARNNSLSTCTLIGRSFVTIEDIRFQGGPAGVQLANAEGIRLNRCVFSANAPLRARSVRDIDLRFCHLKSGTAPAVQLDGANNADISLTNTLIEAAGGPAVSLGETPPSAVFTDYNDYIVARGPLFTTAAGSVAELGAWRKASGLDVHSFVAPPDLAGKAQDRLAPGSPLVGAGQLGNHVGPYPVTETDMQQTIADVQLREATPASASFTWWTPHTSSVFDRPTNGWWDGPMRLCRIAYGTTPACGDGSVDSFGDLYHRVTLFDLKPATTYYYRVELNGAPVRTAVAMFATPDAKTWQPKRRTLYVAPDGDDANDGLSLAHALRTLTKAGEEARAGDTVLIADGVYQETIAPVASGAAGAPITFKAEHLNGVVLDGSNFHRPTAVYAPEKEHLVIDGFVMRQFAPKNLGRRAGMEYAQIVLWGARHIVVQNCVQYGYGNYGEGGVLIGADDVTLRNNAIVGFACSWNGRDNKRVRIVGNTFYMPMITAMRITATDLVLRDNLFFGKSAQKYVCATFTVPSGADADYNAYVFNADDEYRHISGAAFTATAKGQGGLAEWRAYSKRGAHSIELPAAALHFTAAPVASDRSADFAAFWRPYSGGEKAPALALFALPADSRLNTAGEDGRPVGCRPVRRQ